VNNVETAQYSATVKALVARSSQLAALVQKEIDPNDPASTARVLNHWGNVILKLKSWNNWCGCKCNSRQMDNSSILK